MEPIIDVHDLTKIYRSSTFKIYALNQVSCEIYPGEFCSIVGTSGCGKSTMLSLLAGIENPTAGRIFIKNKAIHQMTEHQLVNFRLKNVGFVFQAFHLFPYLTVKENICLPLIVKGTGRKQREKLADELMERIGLLKHASHLPQQLSGGQQQRVSIARAIITSPAIVFADEPTGNLDSQNSKQIMDLFYDINQNSGTTVVMVTHDMDQASKTDRIIHLLDGCIQQIESNKQPVH